MSPYSPLLLLSLLLTPPFATASFPSNCSVRPISLPIRNITIATGVAVNRGLSANLGGQELGLRLTTRWNDVRVRNSIDCGSTNLSFSLSCQGASGSSFSTAEGFIQAPQGEWNGTTGDGMVANEVVVDGWTTAKFEGLKAIPGLPIEVYHDSKSKNRSGLSIGPDSSFFKSLSTANLIPSAAFGLFMGSRSQTRGLDGILTLGGYDKKRVNGEWINFTISGRDRSIPSPYRLRFRYAWN